MVLGLPLVLVPVLDAFPELVDFPLSFCVDDGLSDSFAELDLSESPVLCGLSPDAEDLGASVLVG